MFKKLPLPFVFVLGAGIVLSLLMSLKAMMPYLYWDEMSEFEYYRSSLPHVINYLFWPLLVPIIYWAFTHYRIGKGASIGDRGMSFLFSLVIPFVHEISTTLIYFTLLAGFDIFYFSSETWPQVMAAFPGVFIGRVLEYWIIYVLFAAFDYYKKYKDKQAELGRIEAQLNRTKLEVLKMQLQPHFLFNALNTISSLMEIDVKKAQKVTARLGDLLRGILEQDSRVFVSLEEELDYVKTYLEIERVHLAMMRKQGDVHIVVKDTGLGIAEVDRDKIFEPFFQSHASAESTIEGSGLGLSISKHSVEQMQGRIWLESELGEGSTFTIAFKALDQSR